MILRYKRGALRDLEGVHNYISQFDAAAANRVIGRIQHSISRLSYLPHSGRLGPNSGTRIVVVPGLPDVAIYCVREDAVEILAIIHTARKRRS